MMPALPGQGKVAQSRSQPTAVFDHPRVSLERWAHRYVTIQETGRNCKILRDVEPAGLVSAGGAQLPGVLSDKSGLWFGGSWPTASVRPDHLLDGTVTAEKRDNYHRGAFMNDRNHASGALVRGIATPHPPCLAGGRMRCCAPTPR